MKTTSIATLLIATVLLGACTTSYRGRTSVPVQHTTEIIYKENDFQMRRTHLTGSAECGYVFLLGAIEDPRVQSRALQELYQSVTADSIGRSTQLVNWTQDQVWTAYPFPFLPLYSTHRVVMSADLIEYVK